MGAPRPVLPAGEVLPALQHARLQRATTPSPQRATAFEMSKIDVTNLRVKGNEGTFCDCVSRHGDFEALQSDFECSKPISVKDMTRAIQEAVYPSMLKLLGELEGT